MIAEVIKSSLSRPCAMTIPNTQVARERYCGAMRNAQSLAVAFRHDAGEIMVSVLMQTHSGDPAGPCKA